MEIRITKDDVIWILFMSAILFALTYYENLPGDAAHLAAACFACFMIAAFIHFGVGIACDAVRKYRKREKDGEDPPAD